jgi:hypothetical protein
MSVNDAVSMTDLLDRLREQQRRLRARTAETASVLDDVTLRMLRDHPDVRIERGADGAISAIVFDGDGRRGDAGTRFPAATA